MAKRVREEVLSSGELPSKRHNSNHDDDHLVNSVQYVHSRSPQTALYPAHKADENTKPSNPVNGIAKGPVLCGSTVLHAFIISCLPFSSFIASSRVCSSWYNVMFNSQVSDELWMNAFFNYHFRLSNWDFDYTLAQWMNLYSDWYNIFRNITILDKFVLAILRRKKRENVQKLRMEEDRREDALGKLQRWEEVIIEVGFMRFFVAFFIFGSFSEVFLQY